MSDSWKIGATSGLIAGIIAGIVGAISTIFVMGIGLPFYLHISEPFRIPVLEIFSIEIILSLIFSTKGLGIETVVYSTLCSSLDIISFYNLIIYD